MSRLLPLLLFIATLSGCGSTPMPPAAPPATSTRTQPPSQPTPPPPAPRQPLGPSFSIDPEVIVTPLQIAREATPPRVESHIALLLPLNSRDFSRAADAVREGFEAAAAHQPAPAPLVKLYPLADEAESLFTAYKQATAAGGRCIVAGLTRDGASGLAISGIVSVPTLTLNYVDPRIVPRTGFYTLSLSIEDEARQVAKLIASQGLSRVAILTGPSPLAKRIRHAFEEEWLRIGREIVANVQTSPEGTDYGKLRTELQTADSIFLAGESAFARQVMPYITRNAPIFATSQVHDGKNNPGINVDLQGIRFLEMPWLVDSAHVGVAVYPRSAKLLSADLDRLYALGIDAYRLAHLIAVKGSLGPGGLDGVTGEITLRDGYRFHRELAPAYFEAGQAVLLKSTSP